MTIHVVNKETDEIIESYDDPIAYDIDTNALTISAGRGETTTLFGDDILLRVETQDEDPSQDIDPIEAMARLEAIL